MAESFYGGINGQSFEIKKTFETRVALEQDLTSRWASPVSVGEYVAVSYGFPNEEDDSYKDKRDTDITAYGKSYNSTIWQKSYDEKLARDTGNGLYYKPIFTMTGYTPRFTVDRELVGALTQPTVTIDPNNVDAPNLHFELPSPWTMEKVELKPEQTPTLQVIEEEDGVPLEFPYLRLSLPNPWKFEYNCEVLHANQDPVAEVVKDVSAETVTFKFKLPKAERFQIVLDPVPLTAGSAPQLTYDESNPDLAVATLKLPTTPVFAEPEYEVMEPAADPVVQLAVSSTNNEPKLLFKLPRAVRWHFGNQLGQNNPAVAYYVTGLSGFQVGDMYINTATGYVYESVQKDAGDSNPGVKVYYRGCLQTPKPTVDSTTISPYEDQGDSTFAPAEPSVTPTVSSTGWNLDFALPKAPIPQVETTYISSEDAGSSSVKPSSADNIKFTFNIPAGTRMIPGVEVDDDNTSAVVADAKKGDLYLNTESGNYYKLDENGTWVLQGCLIGPIGNALNIIAYLTIDESETTRDQIPAVIAEELAAAGKTASAEAIVAVSLTNLADEEESYWYVYVDDTWSPLSLTGGIGSALRRYTEGYLDSSDTTADDKAYSVKYINSIIGGEKTETNKTKTAYSKDQVYTTNETYNKDETYNKTEVYTKAEIDALLNTWGTFDDIEEE